MNPPADFSRPMIESLYEDALALADDVRAAFALEAAQDRDGPPDIARVAKSVEGLRTTTRIMHILAWLLNHRAFFAGELNEFQLRRHGILPDDRPADPQQVAQLPHYMQELIQRTVRLHARISRLDAQWRTQFAMEPPAVMRLQARLGRAMARA